MKDFALWAGKVVAMKYLLAAVIAFGVAWHVGGKVDRAYREMGARITRTAGK